MNNLFNNRVLYTVVMFILGLIAFFTRELVTFVMLGFMMILLTNIYDKLDEISRKLGKY
jgi:uncharacterized membrane protein